MSKHDKLGYRLGLILTHLNNGESLAVRELSEEFNVCEKTDGIWYVEDLIAVLISVSAHVAPWFTRRHLLPEQEIIHTSLSCDLLLISHVAYTNQITPLMKCWMPNVEVIQPISIIQQLAEDIQSSLKHYTSSTSRDMGNIIITECYFCKLKKWSYHEKSPSTSCCIRISDRK